jgi:GcrA cell cycle regulator
MTLWTGENITILEMMVDIDASAATIAKKIGNGCTRNAVLGKIHRMGLSGKRKVTQYGGKPRGPGKKRKHNTTRLQAIFNGHDVPFVEVPTINDLEIPTEQRKTLIELENCHCRFPVGEPGRQDFFFCGDPTADLIGGRPYCASHSKRAISASGTARSRAKRHEWIPAWQRRQAA